MQKITLAHEIPRRPDPGPELGLGLGTIDQRVPSHRSTNVFESPASSIEEPTAKQYVARTQDTSSSSLSSAGRLGDGTIDHEGAAPAGDASPTTEPDANMTTAIAATINRAIRRRRICMIPSITN